MGRKNGVIHVGPPVDEPWAALPDDAPTTRTDPEDWDDAGDGGGRSVVVVRLDGGDAAVSVRDVSERFPDAATIAYTVDDDVDAAIDAGRHDVEYVSGRRLADDDETLADRVARVDARDPDAGGRTNDEFLERFLRATADRSMDIESKIDRLLEIGRNRLDLTIGFTSRIEDDRFEVTRQIGAGDLLQSFIEAGALSPDGTVELKTTYCRRTVEDDGVTAFSDPSESDWENDPAYELFGLES